MDVAHALETRTCFRTKFRRSTLNRFGVGRGRVPKNWERWGPLPWDGDVADSWKYATSHMCYTI